MKIYRVFNHTYLLKLVKIIKLCFTTPPFKRGLQGSLLPHNLAPSAKPSQGTKTSGTWKMLPMSSRKQIPSL